MLSGWGSVAAPPNGLWTEIDADVEARVIVIRFMSLAPLAIPVHLVDVAVDLATMFAETTGIAVNAAAIAFKARATRFFMVAVCANCGA